VVRTSQFIPTLSGWRRNGAGLEYNPKVGFGLIDSNKMIEAAIQLKNNVGPQLVQKVPTDAALDRSVLLKDAVYEISFTATDERIKYLEHVEVVGSIEMWKRGCLEARIISPSGTVSKVMQLRKEDKGRDFKKWPFMSVHFWGENPAGRWRFQLTDGCTGVEDNRSLEPTVLGDHFLVLYGTAEEPEVSRLVQPVQHDLESLVVAARMSRARSARDIEEDSGTTYMDSRKLMKGKNTWEDLIGQDILVRENIW